MAKLMLFLLAAILISNSTGENASEYESTDPQDLFDESTINSSEEIYQSTPYDLEALESFTDSTTNSKDRFESSTDLPATASIPFSSSQSTSEIPLPTSTKYQPSTSTQTTSKKPLTTSATYAPTTSVPTTQSTTEKPLTTSATYAPTTSVPTTQSTTEKPLTTSATYAPTTSVPTTQSTTEIPSTTSTTYAPTTSVPTTQSTTEKPAPITFEIVILKKKELTTFYQNVIKEIDAETKMINQTYSNLFEDNFKMYQGPKAVDAVKRKLWIGEKEKIIMGRIIECAEKKKHSFMQSVRNLNNCRNTYPGNVHGLKKEILHVYATAINKINDALIKENICEEKDCVSLFEETNTKIVKEIIPSTMREIAQSKRRVLAIRSHLELCYESIKLDHKSTEILNKNEITNCALWKIRKHRVICKISLTNCNFSQWLISILPWNLV